jgi:hypothetical protein
MLANNTLRQYMRKEKKNCILLISLGETKYKVFNIVLHDLLV